MTMKGMGVYDIAGVSRLPANSYESALLMAASLSREERLRLIRELALAAANGTDSEE